MKYFLLYLVIKILQLVHWISGFPKVLYKIGDKKLLKITGNHKGSSHLEVFRKKMFLKILQNSQKSIFSGVLFSLKRQGGNLKLSEAVAEDVQ